MADGMHLELLEDDRRYLTEHWEELRSFHSSILQSVDFDTVYLHSVFSWIGSSYARDFDAISTQVLEYYANNSNEVILATYDQRHAIVTLDVITGRINSASFEKRANGLVERVEHFVNQTLEKFYQSCCLFDHYRALIMEQADKTAYLFQLMKALMALDKQLIINNDLNNDQFWNQQCLYLHEQYATRQAGINLTREEEISKILERAGWYPGRHVNMEEFEGYCRQEKLLLFPAAQTFLQEFNGLTLNYFIYYRGGYHISKRTNHLYDFLSLQASEKRKYLLMPTLNLTSAHISDFNRILIFSEESCIALGEFGYYHSLLAIGQSGRLYLAHEFSEEIEVFDNLPAVLAWDMEQTKLVSDALILANEDKLLRLNQAQSHVFGYASIKMISILLDQLKLETYTAILNEVVDTLRQEAPMDVVAFTSLANSSEVAGQYVYQSILLIQQLLGSEKYYVIIIQLYEHLKSWHTHYGTAYEVEYEETIHHILVSILYQDDYRMQKDLSEHLAQYENRLTYLKLD